MGEPLTVEYDAERDVLTIDGFQYIGAMFREHLLQPTPDGIWLRVERVEDHRIIMEQATELRIANRVQAREAEAAATPIKPLAEIDENGHLDMEVLNSAGVNEPERYAGDAEAAVYAFVAGHQRPLLRLIVLIATAHAWIMKRLTEGCVGCQVTIQRAAAETTRQVVERRTVFDPPPREAREGDAPRPRSDTH